MVPRQVGAKLVKQAFAAQVTTLRLELLAGIGEQVDLEAAASMN